MKSSSAVIALIVAVTALGLVPALWVLAREKWLRVAAGIAVRRLEEALRALDPAQALPIEVVRRTLRRFDARTIERALETMLRSDDAAVRALGARLFQELGYLETLTRRVRQARKWSERAHAAEVLGLAAMPEAVPALVEAIRDPHEDVGSVKLAAAEALAKLRDAKAVPLLVEALHVVDEHASPRVADALVRFGAAAVEPLIDLLADPERGPARVWAARVLGRIGDPRALDPLVARLYDRSDLLRVAAAEALGALRDKRALAPIVQATLRDPAPQVRAHAAAAASAIAGAGAVDVLVSALSDPDYGTRLRALEAFEHIEVHDTKGLEGALHDVNPEVRRRAALALERVGFLSRVVEELASSDPAVAKRAYRDLLRLGAAGIVDSIVGYLHHARFEVRAQIATACGELADARVGPLLVSAMDDEAWPVRAALCEAIGRLRPDGGPPALARALSDPAEVVREAAATALAEYPDEALKAHWEQIAKAYAAGTVPVRWQVVGMAVRVGADGARQLLLEASRDPSERVRARAVAALAGRIEAVDAIVERLTDSSLEVRMVAVTALGSAVTEAAFEGLVRALPGAPPDARDRIAQALASCAQGKGGEERAIGDANAGLVLSPKLLDRLVALSRSEVLDVRLGIAWTLGKSGDPAAVPALARLLEDESPVVRASAAGALGKIPVPAAASALQRAADDRDARTRAAVVNALGKIASSSDGASAVLERRLTDPDGFVRNRAAIAMARVGAPSAASAIAKAEGARMIDEVAAAIAWALLPGEEALEKALATLADADLRDRVFVAIAREDASVRAAFHARLRLEPPAEEGKVLDSAAIVAQYERVLLTSQDVEARLVAVEALSRVRHDRSIDLLADVLGGDPAERVRLRAARALARAQDDAVARRALVRAIADPSVDVTLVAVRALGEARDASAAASLHKRLGLGTPEVNAAIEEAIASIHRTDVIGLLDRMMGEDRPEALAAAVRVLERIASREALPLLEQLVLSRDALVRSASVRACAAIAGREAARIVDKALEDPSEDVRVTALEALAASCSEAALERLSALRGDPSVVVRVRLARVLAGFPAGAAAPLLEALATDVAAPVRASALATMLASCEAASLAAFARHWPKAAIDTRHELRDDPRAATITDRLAGVLGASVEPEQRAAAVAGISALAAPGWPLRLVLALRDPSPDVRIAAVRALAPVDDDDVRARVGALLADPDERVRESARRAQMRVVG